VVRTLVVKKGWTMSVPVSTVEGFGDTGRLRRLLRRLNDQGVVALRDDPELDALLRFGTRRYSALARKHGRPVEDAGAAVFHAILGGTVAEADDPWAVITTAVKITLSTEQYAEAVLCSESQARRSRMRGLHDTARFCEIDPVVGDWHPAFRVDPEYSFDTGPDTGNGNSDSPGGGSGVVFCGWDVENALGGVREIFTVLGWPESVVAVGLDWICDQLNRTMSRTAVIEAGRKDATVSAVLGIPRKSWLVLLKVVAGSADPVFARTRRGRGVLIRLLVGETVADILCDNRVTEMVLGGVPSQVGR
jgi:hypothetical protein